MLSLICNLSKWLSKQSWGWWYETTLRSLWRHYVVRWKMGPSSNLPTRLYMDAVTEETCFIFRHWCDIDLHPSNKIQVSDLTMYLGHPLLSNLTGIDEIPRVDNYKKNSFWIKNSYCWSYQSWHVRLKWLSRFMKTLEFSLAVTEIQNLV